MEEQKRRARNAQRLGECHPWFRTRLQAVIRTLETKGFRPRIQDAWRSEADQLRAFQNGHSKLRYGFHNATGPNGEKQALAADLLDDDNPLKPRIRYLLAVAVQARQQRLNTGLAWGLPASLQRPIEDAITAGNIDVPITKIGWDPCHVEITGLGIAEVKAGRRPGP